MPTNFPGSLDSFTDPVGSSLMSVLPHHAQHANANDAVVAIEAFVGTSSNQPAIQYVSSTGNDANSGLTWGTAKLTVDAAVTALGGAAGVVQVGVGTVNLTGVKPTAPCSIRGLGRSVSRVYVGTDAGTGKYAIDCSNSSGQDPIEIRDLELAGPGNGAFVVGTAPANMTGIATGGKTRLVNLYVQGFYAGIEMSSDHEYFENVKSSNNYYNLYATARLLAMGNQTFLHCDLTGATFASVACANHGGFDTCVWIDSHVGFAPIGFYKETWDGTGYGGMITDNIGAVWFEACGNMCIYDPNTSPVNTTISGMTFYKGFGVEGSGGTYYYSGLPSAACVVGRIFNFTVTYDGSTPAPGGFIYAAATGAPGLLITDKQPAATDFSNNNWLGSTFNCLGGSVGSSIEVATTATQAIAQHAVTAGQVIQQQGTTQVCAFGGDSSHSYMGVAAYSAAAGATVAVWLRGTVAILCSEHITTAGVRLEIDPATPAQVRAVNSDLGTSFAATTQVPSKYPVIAISSNGNSGTNTTIAAFLYAAPHIDPDYVHPGPVSSLPAAGAGNVGQLLTLLGDHSTTADVTYVCVETAAAAYEWVQIAGGTALTLGNGGATNLTALAKSTGTGPSSMAVVGWQTLVIGANTYYVPLFQ